MRKKNGNRQQSNLNRKGMRDNSSSDSIKAEGNVSLTDKGILSNATMEYQNGFGKPELAKKDTAASNIDDFVDECTLLSGNGFTIISL